MQGRMEGVAVRLERRMGWIDAHYLLITRFPEVVADRLELLRIRGHGRGPAGLVSNLIAV